MVVVIALWWQCFWYQHGVVVVPVVVLAMPLWCRCGGGGSVGNAITLAVVVGIEVYRTPIAQASKER